ncbi:hypothetical protein OH76DRAFT_1406565 [Lentinus brumalis]|uniref:F-box domain-containing protein n=1 Tax=Lentinus brumalis TaxID=2498619 RepID=A0A371D2K9_9APHY|nr:hypothetical protein OH76DRAFT_1406565 [Polyporus brumalis]
MPAGIVAMNLDVLCAIMAFVIAMPKDSRPRSIIASMMLVSRALYHEGAKALLSRDVALYDSGDVPSFVECCLAENGIRTGYVRELVLHFFPRSPVTAASLSDLVLKLTNLESVSLPSAASSWTRNEDDDRSESILFDTLASLTTLSRLSLQIRNVSHRAGANHSLQFVKTLRSPLRELYLSQYGSNASAGTRFELSMLSSCAPTLEKVHLTHCTFFSSSPEPQFLKVSQLKISFTVPDPAWLDINDYVRAFPNLKRLTVLNYDIPWQSSSSGDYVKELDDVRNYNRLNFAQAGHFGWPSLEQLSSDVLTAWSLGLSCKVEHLQLVVHSLTYMKRLPELLSHLRPGTLGLQFGTYGLSTSLLKDILAAALMCAPDELNAVTVGVHLAPLEWPHVGTEHVVQAILDPETVVERLLLAIPSLRGIAFEVLDYAEYSARITLDRDS